MKYNEPVVVSIQPIDYCVFEDESERIDYDDVPRDPRFDGNLLDIDENDPRFGKYCGGKFNWGIHNYPSDPKEDMTVKIHLMRLWATTMYTQLASGLSYHSQGDSNVRVELTEEELNVLSKINTKICTGIYNEIYNLENSFIRKKTIKKVGL